MRSVFCYSFAANTKKCVNYSFVLNTRPCHDKHLMHDLSPHIETIDVSTSLGQNLIMTKFQSNLSGVTLTLKYGPNSLKAQWQLLSFKV